MNDSEWLHKVKIAYDEYRRQFPNEDLSARLFVKWLHQQYGIVFKENNNGQTKT